jgi:hypothetical protein
MNTMNSSKVSNKITTIFRLQVRNFFVSDELRYLSTKFVVFTRDLCSIFIVSFDSENQDIFIINYT